jgi:hypothetical protein
MGNATMAVTHWDISVAVEQAAPLSQVCQVWAPSYRSQTLPTVAKGLAGDDALLRSTFAVAYASVLPAWQWFLAHTGGKPIILIGDSQGSAILIRLIAARVDHEPSVLRRLLDQREGLEELAGSWGAGTGRSTRKALRSLRARERRAP